MIRLMSQDEDSLAGRIVSKQHGKQRFTKFWRMTVTNVSVLKFNDSDLIDNFNPYYLLVSSGWYREVKIKATGDTIEVRR